MKAILADPAIKKAMISISPTSRQSHYMVQIYNCRAHRSCGWLTKASSIVASYRRCECGS